MLWHRKHEPDAPPTHAVLRHGSQGWDGTPGDYWVDPRNQRVLWAHNPHLPAVPPKLPAVPLPSSNRRQRREMPGLNRINRDTLRQYRAAPAYTGNSASGTASSASSVATSGTISPTANNCLAGFVICPTVQTVSSVVDDGGAGGASLNTYTLGSPANNASGGRIYPFYGNNITGTGLHLTANLSGSATVAAIGVCEYSGVGSIAGNRTLIDASGATTGSTSSATSLSIIPQQSGSLYVAGIGDIVGGITYAAGGSLTRRVSLSTSVGLAIAEQVGSASSLAALNSSFTPSGAVQWAEAAIVLRPAGSQASLNFRATNGASVTLLTSGTFNPQPGWLLVAQSVTTSAGVTTTSVLDANGFTWNKLLSQSYPGGGELSVWYAWATSNATNTFTANFSGTTNAATEVWTLPGVLPSANPFDVVTATTGTGTAVSIGPSAVTAIPGETAILFTGAMGSASLTPGGSDTLAISQPTANGSNGATTRTLNATGTVTMTGTLGPSQNWIAILVTLKTGGVSLVQSNGAAVSSGSGPNGAGFTFNCAPGNNLIAGGFVTGLTTTQTMSSISDGVNTWSEVPNPASNPNATNGEEVSLWRAKNIAGGKTTVLYARAGPSKSGVLIYEVSGCATDTFYDVGATTSGNGQTVSLTNPQPNYLFRLVVAAGGDNGTGRAYANAAPFAQPQAVITTQFNFAVGLATVFEPGVVPTGTSTTLAIPGGVNVQYVGAIADFKIAGSPTVEYLAATITGTSAVSGALTVTRALRATVTGTSSLTGSLTVTHRLVATVTGSSSLTGALTVTHRLSATVSGASVLAGNLTVTHLLTASSAGVSTLTGALRVTHQLVATVSGASALAGAVTVTRLLHGAILGTSVVSGTLTVRYETLPVVTSVAFALNAATTSPHPRNSATSRPFALNTAVTGVDV